MSLKTTKIYFQIILDTIVKLHDINGNLKSIQTLQRTRGATFFALHTEKITSTTGDIHYLIRLAVVVRRKIQLYYLKNNRLQSLCEDVTLTDTPKAISLCQNVICLVYRDKYTSLTLGDGKETDLIPTSNTNEPCLLAVSDSHFLLSRDEQTILVKTSGETNRLKWPDSPIYLAHDEPYTLGVLTDSILVCSLEPGKAIQALIDMPKVRLLVRAKCGIIFAASLCQIWCLVAVDYAKQEEILLDAMEFELALKIIQISDECEEEKQAKVNYIRSLLAYQLFVKKQFAESMREFLKSGTDPYDVIGLYPDMLPQNAQDEIPINFKKLTEQELQDSILALCDYLTTIRNESGNANELMRTIDTILVKCYLQTKDAMVGLILRQNNCDFVEIEKLLKKMQRFDDLLTLYETKGHHKKALELLQLETTLKEDNLAKTIDYLQQLGPDNIEIIFEFSEWVLILEPERGIEIFTADLIEVEHLPRPVVLDFLLKEHPNLVIQYLEHVIDNWEEQSPSFHNTLINQYLEKISAQGNRDKLLKFLDRSTQYNTEEILKNFPDNLLEEKALILGRLGLHDQAIALYVRVLGDVELAETYCNRKYRKEDIESQNVYVYLIKLLLNPDNHKLGVTLSPKTAKPDMERALRILKDNAAKIDPLEILPELPNDVSVSEIHTFLTVAWQKVLRERREGELMRGLLYAQFLQSKERRMNLLNKHVLITELSVCPACKKRFSNQTALVRYPNGDVVHFACFTER
ncbi:unnamed protein product [Ceutorhynchus assimilis]|uniref:CNH domain-containing protein n=1 Tax=Ceutorhynchus assimilis TaxID=467358 RepID=A0A9N9QKE0_9CUCU|nr:unnamed protein product [Ceutorhynchus assimilis]